MECAARDDRGDVRGAQSEGLLYRGGPMSETRIIETTFEAGSYIDGIRSPAYFQFRSRVEANDWARERARGAEHEGRAVRVVWFDWTKAPDHRSCGRGMPLAKAFVDTSDLSGTKPNTAGRAAITAPG